MCPDSSESGVTTKLVTAAAWSNLSAQSDVISPMKASISAPISPNQKAQSGCTDVHRHARPQQHRQPHREPDQEGAGHRGADQPRDQLACRERRHQIIDDVALHLADQQREAGIGEGVLDHRHDDQARSDEIGERNAHHGPAAAAQRDGENCEIKESRDRRRPDGLHLHLEEPAHLLDIEGLEPAPVDAV